MRAARPAPNRASPSEKSRERSQDERRRSAGARGEDRTGAWHEDLLARTARAKTSYSSALYRRAPAEVQRRCLQVVSEEHADWLDAAEQIHVADGFRVLLPAALRETIDGLTYRFIGRSVLRAMRGW